MILNRYSLECMGIVFLNLPLLSEKRIFTKNLIVYNVQMGFVKIW